MPRKKTGRDGAGEVRIIGGTWRHRRIHFPAEPGIRPTPDRLRETLFNWLGEWIVGRRVLDLFAGSGALGIEALSRGAGEAVFVERSPTVAWALSANLERLQARCARVEKADARAWLKRASGPYDLVFLDPPYRSDAGPAVFTTLSKRGLLAPDHRVYREQARSLAAEPPFAGWEVLRESRAGDAVGRLLYCRHDLTCPPAARIR